MFEDAPGLVLKECLNKLISYLLEKSRDYDYDDIAQVEHAESCKVCHVQKEPNRANSFYTSRLKRIHPDPDKCRFNSGYWPKLFN